VPIEYVWIPKRVPGYPQVFNRDMSDTSFEMYTTSIEVEGNGDIELLMTVTHEFKLPGKKKVPDVGPKLSAKQLVGHVTTRFWNAFNDVFPVAMIQQKARIREMNQTMCTWIQQGMEARLRLYVDNSRLEDRIDVYPRNFDIRRLDNRTYSLMLSFYIRMPYYGLYVDVGRGPATKRSVFVDRHKDDMRTAFDLQMVKWVEEVLGLDGAEGRRVADSIRKNINSRQTPAKPFLRDTLIELDKGEKLDDLVDDLFDETIEGAIKLVKKKIEGEL